MLYLCRYGELGLKSPAVRKRFIGRMIRHMGSLFLHNGISFAMNRERGRLYIEAEDSPAVRELLSRIFGLVSFSPIDGNTGADLEDIAGLCTDIAGRKDFRTFGVRCRRTGSHPYSSQEAAAFVGGRVGEAFPGAVVDLGDPDLALNVEIRNNRSYIYTEVIPGPGGLPLGSQGLVLGLLQRREDVLGIWMMLRRGCHVTLLTEEPTLAEPLKIWDPDIRIRDGGTDTEDVLAALEEIDALGIVTGALGPGTYPQFAPHPVYAPAAFLERDVAYAALERVEKGSVPDIRGSPSPQGNGR